MNVILKIINGLYFILREVCVVSVVFAVILMIYSADSFELRYKNDNNQEIIVNKKTLIEDIKNHKEILYEKFEGLKNDMQEMQKEKRISE